MLNKAQQKTLDGLQERGASFGLTWHIAIREWLEYETRMEEDGTKYLQPRYYPDEAAFWLMVGRALEKLGALKWPKEDAQSQMSLALFCAREYRIRPPCPDILAALLAALEEPDVE